MSLFKVSFPCGYRILLTLCADYHYLFRWFTRNSAKTTYQLSSAIGPTLSEFTAFKLQFDDPDKSSVTGLRYFPWLKSPKLQPLNPSSALCLNHAHKDSLNYTKILPNEMWCRSETKVLGPIRNRERASCGSRAALCVTQLEAWLERTKWPSVDENWR